MANKREQQFAIKVQSDEATEATIAAANYAGVYKGLDFADMIGEYQRETVRATLSKDAALKGPVMGKISGTCECLGGGADTTASDATPWHHLLRSSGMKRVQVKMAQVGTLTGGTAANVTIGRLIGDNATQGSATKTGVIVDYVAGSPNKLWYIPTAGTFTTSDTIYVYGSPTQSMPISVNPIDGGFKFELASETAAYTPECATAYMYQAGQLHRLISARSTVKFNWAHKAPLLITFETQGALKLTGGTLAAASPQTGIPAIGGPPKMCFAMPFTLDALSPVFEELEIDLANNLTPRATLASNGLVSSGYLATRIADRAVKGTVAPETPAPGTKDYFAQLMAGSTFVLYSKLGLAGDTNGAIIAHAPAAQMQGDHSQGDRNGIVTTPMALALTGATDDEFALYHLFG